MLLNWQKCSYIFRNHCQDPEQISCILRVYVAELRNLVVSAQGQLHHWWKLLWRKLKVRACTSFPLGTAFKRLYCQPSRWAAVKSVINLISSSIHPALVPYTLAGPPGLPGNLPCHCGLARRSLHHVWLWTQPLDLILMRIYHTASLLIIRDPLSHSFWRRQGGGGGLRSHNRSMSSSVQ